jgi:hypothetical protein
MPPDSERLHVRHPSNQVRQGGYSVGLGSELTVGSGGGRCQEPLSVPDGSGAGPIIFGSPAVIGLTGRSAARSARLHDHTASAAAAAALCIMMLSVWFRRQHRRVQMVQRPLDHFVGLMGITSRSFFGGAFCPTRGCKGAFTPLAIFSRELGGV